ncbi:MAG: conserved hypothetical protein [Methanobrevibacter sp. CfCl-M3]
MGKKGSKPKFADVTCSNEDCEDYGKVNNGMLLVMVHTRQKMVKYINFTVKHVKEALHQIQTRFHMI